jgi:uncharacterized protein YjlB
MPEGWWDFSRAFLTLTSKEIAMKQAILVSLVAAAAMVSGAAMAEVKISGKNTQTVTIKNGAVLNAAIGAGATARQNLASNAGTVSIGGDNTQTVTVNNGAVLNAAIGAGTTAAQNLASNTSRQ